MIETISEFLLRTGRYGVERHILSSDIVEFMLADRKRICTPLLVMKKKEFPRMTSNGQLNALWEAGAETLKLAGLEDYEQDH